VDKLLSTNPIAFAIPAGEEPPIVFDAATTVASNGTVTTYAENGIPMPEGWVVDRKGKPITDAARKDEGLFLPIGGHKGYGISLVIGMLAGVMNSAAFGSDVIEWRTDFATPLNTGQAIFVMRPDLFRDIDDFKEETDKKIREMKNSTPMEGMGPIRVPGDTAIIREKEAYEKGILISPPILKAIRELALSLDLDDKLCL